MITLSLLNRNHSDWTNFLSLYLTAFPADERREHAELEKVQGTKGYALYQIANNGSFVGFLEAWEFEEFVFIEHLAIQPDEQQKGYGSQTIKELISGTEKPIILETEPPLDNISLRRIDFYGKAGFICLDFDYTQPPYYPGKQSVPMLLLSNKNLSEETILRYVTRIRQNVYKIVH